MPPGEDAPPPRLRAGQVLIGALNTFRAAWPWAWPIWLTLVLFELASNLVFHMSGVNVLAQAVTVERLIAAATSILGATAIAGAALRAHIAPGAAHRPDSGFFIYVMAVGGAALVSQVPVLATQGMGEQALMGAVFGTLLMGLVFLKLLLWPIARLMGDRSLTFAGAWRLMDGAVWAWILATLVLQVPPTLLGLALIAPETAGDMPPDPDLTVELAIALVSIPAVMASVAINATVWKLRMGGAPDRVSDVFS
jgi:hypothetical protein